MFCFIEFILRLFCFFVRRSLSAWKKRPERRFGFSSLRFRGTVSPIAPVKQGFAILFCNLRTGFPPCCFCKTKHGKIALPSYRRRNAALLSSNRRKKFFFRQFILHDMKYREFALPLRSCVSCFGENRTGNGGKEKGVPFAEISIVEKAHGFYCQSFGSFKDEMLVVGYAVVENASQMSHRK